LQQFFAREFALEGDVVARGDHCPEFTPVDGAVGGGDGIVVGVCPRSQTPSTKGKKTESSKTKTGGSPITERRGDAYLTEE